MIRRVGSLTSTVYAPPGPPALYRPLCGPTRCRTRDEATERSTNTQLRVHVAVRGRTVCVLGACAAGLHRDDVHVDGGAAPVLLRVAPARRACVLRSRDDCSSWHVDASDRPLRSSLSSLVAWLACIQTGVGTQGARPAWPRNLSYDRRTPSYVVGQNRLADKSILIRPLRTALSAANVQKRSEMPDSAMVVRMHRRRMPHMRSA